jgi:NarL family two-component system response regulator LiaR
MSRSQTVVIVDDQELTRAGLRTALEGAGFTIVAEAQDGLAGFDAIERTQPRVAVIDIGLLGIDGIELTRRIRIASPATNVTILTTHELEEEVLSALSAGANAYCLKTSQPSQIIAAVQAAAEGSAYFDAKIAPVVMRNLGVAHVTPGPSPLGTRETEILRMIADGKGNAEISNALNIGLGSVKDHIRVILGKLAASDRTQAAVVALRRGLI